MNSTPNIYISFFGRRTIIEAKRQACKAENTVDGDAEAEKTLIIVHSHLGNMDRAYEKYIRII